MATLAAAPTQEYVIKDIALARFGRDEIQIAETEIRWHQRRRRRLPTIRIKPCAEMVPPWEMGWCRAFRRIWRGQFSWIWKGSFTPLMYQIVGTDRMRSWTFGTRKS